jgi:hypothetical protein
MSDTADKPALAPAPASKTNPKSNERFWKRVEELKLYKAEHGDCNIPSKYPPNQGLACWCSGMRTACRKWYYEGRPAASGLRVDKSRIAILESIGFEWKYDKSGRGRCRHNRNSVNNLLRDIRYYAMQDPNFVMMNAGMNPILNIPSSLGGDPMLRMIPPANYFGAFAPNLNPALNSWPYYPASIPPPPEEGYATGVAGTHHHPAAAAAAAENMPTSTPPPNALLGAKKQSSFLDTTRSEPQIPSPTRSDSIPEPMPKKRRLAHNDFFESFPVPVNDQTKNHAKMVESPSKSKIYSSG